MQEIEIELKNGLTTEEYTYLKNELFYDRTSKKQVNHYFETEDLRLREAGCALRIRLKNDQYVSTLKEPQEEGLLETHDQLDGSVAEAWMENEITLGPNIRKQLDRLGIQQGELKYFGSLTTYRLEKSMDDCLVVIDRSLYHKLEDYELEIEAGSTAAAQHMLDSILSTYQIEKRPISSKIKRFFKAIGKA